MEDEPKVTKSGVHPLVVLGIFAAVCVFVWIALYTRPSASSDSATSTPAISGTPDNASGTVAGNPVETTNQSIANSGSAVSAPSSSSDGSDIDAFETSYQNYLTASGKFFAAVLVFNITGVVPQVQEFTIDLSDLSSANAPATNLTLAENGLSLIQTVSGKMDSSTDGMSGNSEDALLDLNTKAGAIQNPTLKKQALLVASDANQMNQYIINYQSALEDKWSNVSNIFQDVINDGGYMTTAYATIQTSSAGLDADNAVIGQLKAGTNPGYNMQTDFAQFKGMAGLN